MCLGNREARADFATANVAAVFWLLDTVGSSHPDKNQQGRSYSRTFYEFPDSEIQINTLLQLILMGVTTISPLLSIPLTLPLQALQWIPFTSCTDAHHWRLIGGLWLEQRFGAGWVTLEELASKSWSNLPRSRWWYLLSGMHDYSIIAELLSWTLAWKINNHGVKSLYVSYSTKLHWIDNVKCSDDSQLLFLFAPFLVAFAGLWQCHAASSSSQFIGTHFLCAKPERN